MVVVGGGVGGWRGGRGRVNDPYDTFKQRRNRHSNKKSLTEQDATLLPPKKLTFNQHSGKNGEDTRGVFLPDSC